jgi:hypothetical protein
LGGHFGLLKFEEDLLFMWFQGEGLFLLLQYVDLGHHKHCIFLISPFETVYSSYEGFGPFLVLTAELQAGQAFVMKIGVAHAMDICCDQVIFDIYNSAIARGGADPSSKLESVILQGLLVIAYIIKINK